MVELAAFTEVLAACIKNQNVIRHLSYLHSRKHSRTARQKAYSKLTKMSCLNTELRNFLFHGTDGN